MTIFRGKGVDAPVTLRRLNRAEWRYLSSAYRRYATSGNPAHPKSLLSLLRSIKTDELRFFYFLLVVNTQFGSFDKLRLRQKRLQTFMWNAEHSRYPEYIIDGKRLDYPGLYKRWLTQHAELFGHHQLSDYDMFTVQL